jgi:hypothetical protein
MPKDMIDSILVLKTDEACRGAVLKPMSGPSIRCPDTVPPLPENFPLPCTQLFAVRVYIFAEHGKELLCRVSAKIHTAKENHSVKFKKTHGKEKPLSKDLKNTRQTIYTQQTKGHVTTVVERNGATALPCVFSRHSANKGL